METIKKANYIDKIHIRNTTQQTQTHTSTQSHLKKMGSIKNNLYFCTCKSRTVIIKPMGRWDITGVFLCSNIMENHAILPATTIRNANIVVPQVLGGLVVTNSFAV